MERIDFVKDIVLQKSAVKLEESDVVKGYDINNGLMYENMLKSNIGFQSANFNLAIAEINKMLSERRRPLAQEDQDEYEDDIFIKRKNNCTIFLGYTSNIVREIIKNKLIYF
jgi:deoxyhypusine synthase